MDRLVQGKGYINTLTTRLVLGASTDDRCSILTVQGQTRTKRFYSISGGPKIGP
jgi:hypothetical protein